VTPTFPKTDPRKLKHMQQTIGVEEDLTSLEDPTGTEQAARELLGLFNKQTLKDLN
jgi:hypothetical protein